MHDKIQRFSLRKLSVGLASVAIGACVFSINGKTVKADVTSDQTTQTTNVQGQTAIAQPQSNDVQNEKQQTSSDQNSVADQSQKNLMDDLGKQKTSAQSGDQAEAKNQENRLVDQINYKLTNNTSTDSKEDLGQNLTAPDETKSNSTTKSDAEKSIVSPSSAQQTNNQSNDHADDNSQSQNEQKLDITKNSKKLAKKVLATNLIETNSSTMTNGGFDEATWGKLDVNNWQGSVQDGLYQLTNYTGDGDHVIVPNEADFEKAGISTSGKQVGVTSDLMRIIFHLNATANDATVAFSKTGNKMVKAIGSDWSNTWTLQDRGAKLSRFDGTNLDVSNVTNMSNMFDENPISDLSSLANWDTSNVTDMVSMFNGCESLSDISPLANWDVSSVTDMSYMFDNCNKLSDISPLANWDVSSVTDMSYMFDNCNKLSDVSSLANWDTSKVTGMVSMFNGCESLSDISPLAHWDTSNVNDMASMFANCSNLSDISPLANWDTSKVNVMGSMFENTPLKKVTLTNWDFSNINPSYGYASIFPDTNFEATLSDKTSKSLLGIASQLSDSAKENLKEIDSAPIVDGVPDVNGDIQQYLDSIKQGKEWYQQQLASYKQQIDYYEKELADPNADATTKENDQDKLKQAEQEYQYYLTGDGKKEYDGQIQDLQEQFNQYKQEIQQKINQYKLQAEYPLNSIFGNHSKITTSNQDLLVYLVGKLPVKSDATRTIEITFPNGTKKTINQSVGYGKYAISGTADMATHKLDMAMPYELSKWELIKKEDGSYDLVKAHVDKNGIAIFDAVKIPHINGYKAHLIKDPVNPTAFLVSFMAVPEQPQNNQSTSNNDQSSQKPAQTDQKQPEPIQTIPAKQEQEDKQIDQLVRTISYTLMHDSSDTADSFEPVQDNSDSFEAPSDSTQKDDAAKPQKVNAAKHKKHIAKKHVVKRHKKHAKKYHLKRRSRKHSKRSKKRIIKHRKSVSRKFRKHNLKHVKKN